jgi:hypothetical protein
VKDGDQLIVFVDLGRSPVTNPLQQPRHAGVRGRILAENEAHPVPARLELAALAHPAASFSQRLPEPLRARRAELHPHQPLHPDQPNQPRLHPILKVLGRGRPGSDGTESLHAAAERTVPLNIARPALTVSLSLVASVAVETIEQFGRQPRDVSACRCLLELRQESRAGVPVVPAVVRAELYAYFY